MCVVPGSRSAPRPELSLRALRVILLGFVRVFCLALLLIIGVLINLEEGRGRSHMSLGEQLAW